MTLLYLIIGIGSFSMGVACLSFALLLLLGGDPAGLFGLAVGAINLYWGCWGLRKSKFLEPEGDR